MAHLKILLIFFQGFCSITIHGQDFDALAQGFQQARALSAPKAMLALPAFTIRDIVDLRDQFPPGKVPDQGKVGTCHVFATVGLLEAAYYRRYGSHIAFSEADLFAQSRVGTGAIYSEASVCKTYAGTDKCMLGEGAWPAENLQFILNFGILPANAGGVSYEQFAQDYIEDLKKPIEASLSHLHSRGLKIKQSPTPALKKLQKIIWESVPFASEIRRRVRDALAGFEVAHLYFDRLPPERYLHISPKECGEISRDRRKKLIAELKAGRPVEVSLALLGMPAWKHATHRPSDAVGNTLNHSVLVVGLRQDGAGRYSFRTRNSWIIESQPVNPDLGEDELCHIIGMTRLLTSKEAATLPLSQRFF